MKNENIRKSGTAMDGTESEWMAILENEVEANQYAARCLTVCAGVGAVSWLLNLIGIFIIPANIMNIGMPVTILFFLIPTLICKATGGKPFWVKYAVTLCGIISIFILSAAMPKHGVLAQLFRSH